MKTHQIIKKLWKNTWDSFLYFLFFSHLFSVNRANSKHGVFIVIIFQLITLRMNGSVTFQHYQKNSNTTGLIGAKDLNDEPTLKTHF